MVLTALETMQFRKEMKMNIQKLPISVTPTVATSELRNGTPVTNHVAHHRHEFADTLTAGKFIRAFAETHGTGRIFHSVVTLDPDNADPVTISLRNGAVRTYFSVHYDVPEGTPVNMTYRAAMLPPVSCILIAAGCSVERSEFQVADVDSDLWNWCDSIGLPELNQGPLAYAVAA